MNDDYWFCLEEAAAYLDMKPWQLSCLGKDGPRRYRKGEQVVYRMSDLRKWADKLR